MLRKIYLTKNSNALLGIGCVNRKNSHSLLAYCLPYFSKSIVWLEIGFGTYTYLLILYADDMVIFANNAAELQTSLDLMYEYCNLC